MIDIKTFDKMSSEAYDMCEENSSHQGSRSPEKKDEANRREVLDMFDLMDLKQRNVQNEHVDVQKEMDRFRDETGHDFLDLLHNRQARVKSLVDGADNHDTDDDEEKNQDFYGPMQCRDEAD